jgi:hypothetical protein
LTLAPWWLTDADDIAGARKTQDDRRVADEWEDPIRKFIRDKADAGAAVTGATDPGRCPDSVGTDTLPTLSAGD